MSAQNVRHAVITKPLFNALAAGLALSQVVATVFVYRSNAELARKMTSLQREGYLAVPGPTTLPPIESFGAAFWGGLFYTLSVGAALTLIGIAAARLYIRFFKLRRYLAGAYVLVWAGLLYAVNAGGFAPIVSLYFLFVPACAFSVTVAGGRQAPGNARSGVKWAPVMAVACLAVFWTSQLNDRLFLNIRDYFLLSNPIGAGITDFYYRYTLFAAEPFKSLNQKTLRICNLSGLPNTELRRRVENRLRHYDYLDVSAPADAELTVSATANELIFSRNGRVVFQAQPEAFLSRTAELLVLFAHKTDRYGFFRSFTFYAILVAFPLLLFTGLYGLLRYLTGIFMRPAPATLVSAGVCLLLGAAPIILIQFGSAQPVGPDFAVVNTALDSGQWQRQVAALRTIEEHEMEIAEFSGHRDLLEASPVPVRYWTARAFSVSRRSETIGGLLFLLQDPEPIVVCQALYALGKRQHRPVTPAVISILNRSTSWYVQQYAYRALRSIGWKQPVSN